jgi:hypothetical protein
MKQAVIAPSMMYLLYPLQGELEGYPRAEFIKDLIDEVNHIARFMVMHWLMICMQCEKDIRGCFEIGAKRVSIDFTEGLIAQIMYHTIYLVTRHLFLIQADSL